MFVSLGPHWDCKYVAVYLILLGSLFGLFRAVKTFYLSKQYLKRTLRLDHYCLLNALGGAHYSSLIILEELFLNSDPMHALYLMPILSPDAGRFLYEPRAARRIGRCEAYRLIGGYTAGTDQHKIIQYLVYIILNVTPCMSPLALMSLRRHSL